MTNIPDYIRNERGEKVDLYFRRSERYWKQDSKGRWYHPPNRMPKNMAFRYLNALPSDKPGIVKVTYGVRMKGEKGESFSFEVCKEVWACCLAKWTGFSIDTLFGYVRDYIAHPGKMESEMYSYTYDDWKALYENDQEGGVKARSGQERYRRSLSTFDRFASLYKPLSKADLTFDADDPVSCYAAYHRATPTYIGSIMGLVPMWMQMEWFKERWV